MKQNKSTYLISLWSIVFLSLAGFFVLSLLFAHGAQSQLEALSEALYSEVMTDIESEAQNHSVGEIKLVYEDQRESPLKHEVKNILIASSAVGAAWRPSILLIVYLMGTLCYIYFKHRKSEPDGSGQ